MQQETHTCWEYSYQA